MLELNQCVQPVSSVEKVGHYSVMYRSAITVDTVVKNAHSDVAFLGEMDQSCGNMLLLLLLMDTHLLCTRFHVLDVSHPQTGSRKNM